MRSKNTLVNIISVWTGQILLIGVNMVSRKVFLDILGSEYLGLNSLFSNIVGLLAVAELGIGSAINYSLYRPLAENDTETIKSLMRLYKRVYCLIGTVILLAGVMITPAIRSIAECSESIQNVEIIFMLFVINTAISYFFSYYSALIIADQKKYIFNFVHYLFQILMFAIQIIILLKTGNYYAYLICQVTATVAENLFMAIITRKKYSYVKEKKIEPITEENKSVISKNVKALILNEIGNTIVTSTDNILISKLINLSIVGIYGNYSTIITAVRNVFWQGITSFTASIGNQLISGKKEECKNIFFAIQLIGSWLYGWGSICLLLLLTPFVKLWYGDFTLAIETVGVLCLNVYLSGQRTVLRAYVSAAGLYYKIKYRAIIEAFMNIVLSIALGKIWGITGIFWGTFISGFIGGWFPETKVIIKNIIDIKIWKYVIIQLKQGMCIAVSALLTILVTRSNLSQGISGFCIDLLICIFLPNIVIAICNLKNPYFRVCVNKLIGVIESFINQKKKKTII